VNDVTGDLWTYLVAAGFGGARVITTNGFVKSNGECVMGRGCAREARDRWPWLPRQLGSDLAACGNHVFRYPLISDGFDLVTFPVKPERGSSGEPGWKAKAELWLIRQSARELVVLADSHRWSFVVLPRPGCGNGQLDYADVRPVLEPILDDRFHVITFA
jgi:hypothetical protein